jgi:hypothetical protein
VPPAPIPAPEPPADDPGVIVIDRGPNSHPEPEPPGEPEVEVPRPEPQDNGIEDHTQPQLERQGPTGKERANQQKARPKPVIPTELKRPVKAGSADAALRDICLGWITGDPKLIKAHVRTNTPVRIYNRGKLSHKMTGREFLELTSDAVTRMETRDFRLKPLSFKNNKVYSSGVHTYVGKDELVRKTRLNYTLKKLGNVWTIVEVGYSPGEIASPAKR